MNWYINMGGQDILAEDLNVEDIQLKFVSFGVDTASLKFAEEFDGVVPAGLTAGSTVKIKRGAETVFVGRAGGVRRTGDVNSSYSIQIDGPFWWFENMTATQLKPFYDWAAGISGEKASAVFTLTGSAATMLTAVITYAITKGAPFTIGTIDLPATPIPDIDCNGHTISQVILAIMRWFPNSISVFDYTTGAPVLSILQHSSATLGTQEVAADDGGLKLSALNVAEENANVVDGVIIRYEANGKRDAVEKVAGVWTRVQSDVYLEVINDAHPPGTVPARNILMSTIIVPDGPLFTAYDWVHASRPFSITGASTWTPRTDVYALCDRFDPLLPSMYSISAITAGAPTIHAWLSDEPVDAIPSSYYPLDPVIDMPWLASVLYYDVDSFSEGLKCFLGRLSFTFTYKATAGGSNLQYTSTITSIYCVDKQGFNSHSDGARLKRLICPPEFEAPVAGLAAALYAELSAKHHSGSVVCYRDEEAMPSPFTRKVSILNIGGATIPGYVQSVTVNSTTEILTFEFGPPAQLGLQDLVELQRIARLSSLNA